MPNPNGATKGNAQNYPEVSTPRTRSTFKLRQLFPNTHRFGEYIPHYVDDLTKDDRYPVHSSGGVRSYTFKSPLLQNITRNKDYFLVPMDAILPLNWEKFFDNPVRGDDVLDDVGPTVENFWSKVGIFYQALNGALQTLITTSTTTPAQFLLAFFRYLVVGEYFYSNGNLLSSLNCHGSSYLSVFNAQGNIFSFDDYFDSGISQFVVLAGGSVGQNNSLFTLSVDGYSYGVSITGATVPNQNLISLRHALQLMRDNPNFSITNVATPLTYSNLNTGLYTNWFNKYSISIHQYNVHCNLSRLWAYQLSVSHYFTNDHIDFVYSADLYRQLIGYYIRSYIGTSYHSRMFFVRNSISYLYDYLSAHCFDIIIGFNTAANATTLLTSTALGPYQSVLGYLSALFGYRRSLRYLDYFTGSRAQPLAVVNTAQINTNVAVNSNQVSVIDITKSIQAQRFLNSVNRVRHSFEGYLKGIFGGNLPAPDYHNPFYMAHTDDVIFSSETENTATEQMTDKIAITSSLKSGSNNYMFEIDTDRPCIIIGITSYEIARVYQHSMDRSFLHINRFDWFNPFMQYIGDQPVYLQELGINPNAGLSSLKNWAYQMRHMEFKQKYNYAAGGFCNPSTDLDLWIFGDKAIRGSQDSINPDWIRSLNAEFDQFYVSLTGWSLGTYFHFIAVDYNSVNASRPMAFAPQILG